MAPSLVAGQGVEGTVGLANKDMMDAIFNPMEPGVAHTCAFHPAEQPPHGPPPSRGRPSHFLAGTPPARGHGCHCPLCPQWCHPTNLPRNGMAAHQRCPCLEAPEASKIGCGPSHARVMCRYAFGVHTWLRAHIACHFRVNFALISREFRMTFT